MIERKAGFKICTAGWQKVLINSTLHLITPGKLQVVSPAFMIQTLDQSDDLEALEVIEDVRMLFPTMRSVGYWMRFSFLILATISESDKPSLFNWQAIRISRSKNCSRVTAAPSSLGITSPPGTNPCLPGFRQLPSA